MSHAPYNRFKIELKSKLNSSIIEDQNRVKVEIVIRDHGGIVIRDA